MVEIIITEYVMYRGKPKKVSDLSPTSGYKVEVVCPECSEVRVVHYRSIARAGHTICQSCIMRAKRGKNLTPGDKYNRLTVLRPSGKSGHSVCKCECGNTTVVSNWHLSTGKTMSCGCLRSENIKKVAHNPSGKAHWNWKGGVTGERYLAMSKKSYKDWRESVFERDSYTCRKCGQVGYRLQAHHIRNYADHPKLRLVAQNGITFCDTCHRELHRRYGLKTNESQLNEFLKRE